MSNPMRDISQDELRDALDYNPNTGQFIWNVTKGKGKRGRPAGSWTREKKRRLIICVNGRRIYGHRAAYIYVYGDLPQNALLDHIDGDSENNRIENLRLVSPAQNTWNKIVKGRAPGVSRSTGNRFHARIQIPDGRKINLGTWATEEEAHAAYMGAAAIVHGEFAPTSRVETRGQTEHVEVGEIKEKKA